MLQNYTFIADKRGVRRSFLLFFSLFLLQVTAFAQNDVRITIRENNITVIEALKKVEKQSGLSIGYNNSLLRDKPALNLNLDKAGLDYSLSTILKGTGCTYELKGKYIKIIPQPAQEKPSSDKQIKGKVTDESVSIFRCRVLPVELLRTLKDVILSKLRWVARSILPI